ncbi:MAG: response regulator [Terracidiphilus sp.]
MNLQQEAALVQSDIVILCVDDEETPLTLRKLVLQRHGFQVVTANSAGMAIEMLNSSHIDLVLSDQLMPGGTGTELAQKIKQTRPGLPVVLLSGVNEIPQDAHFADSFISKVEGPQAICERILGVLAERGFAI